VAYNREKISMLPYWSAHPSFATFLGSSTSSATRDVDSTGHTRTTSSDRSYDDTTPATTPPLLGRSASPVLVVRRKTPQSTPFECRPATRSSRLLSLFPGTAVARTKSSTTTCKTAPQRPARVEPKTYFANERTCKDKTFRDRQLMSFLSSLTAFFNIPSPSKQLFNG
jgi:hypothetical protein